MPMQFSIYRMHTLKKPFSRVVVGVIGVIRKGKRKYQQKVFAGSEGNGIGNLLLEHFLLCVREAIQIEAYHETINVKRNEQVAKRKKKSEVIGLTIFPNIRSSRIIPNHIWRFISLPLFCVGITNT